jgi:hypothetical protein
VEMGVLGYDDFCGHLHDHHDVYFTRNIRSRYLAEEGM